MTRIMINGAAASAAEREIYTSGTVGARLHLEFDRRWDGLYKTAVFSCGDKTADVQETQWENGECPIPHECLATAGQELLCGVYGCNADGSLAIPTVYVSLGVVRIGADPSGDESTEPSLPVWAALRSAVGDLSKLETEAKSDLVSAINEAASSGGEGSKGDKGDKGDTPIKGVDYWTAADKAEIVAAALAALPKYEGAVE